MFDDKLRQQIASFVETSSGEIVEIRARMMQLIHDVIQQLIDSRNDQLDSREDALEKFAAISLEISESIFNNIYNAQPLAASALVEWQINLLRTTSAILFDDGQFDAWCRGDEISGGDLHSLIRDLHQRRCAVDPSAMLTPTPSKFQTDEVTTGQIGFPSASLDYLYDIGTALEFDDNLKWNLRNMLIADVSVLSQVTLVFVCFVASHAGTRANEIERWMSEFGALENQIRRLRSDLSSGQESVN